MRRGAVLEGYRALVAVAEAIRPRDRLRAIRILADAAVSTFGAGNPDDMLPAAQRALELLRPDDPPDDSSDPLVVMCAGVTGLFLREAEAGRDLLDRALVQAREYAPTAALPQVLF